MTTPINLTQLRKRAEDNGTEPYTGVETPALLALIDTAEAAIEVAANGFNAGLCVDGEYDDHYCTQCGQASPMEEEPRDHLTTCPGIHLRETLNHYTTTP
jgi:hypothetical protein